MTIVALDIDAQNTFTPLCEAELPIAGGDEIAAELNAQAALADLRVMSKDAHSPHAKWLCSCHAEQLRPTGLPDAPETWVAHAMVGSFGFELLAGLPKETEYDYCVWKGVSPELHPYGACYHDIAEKLSTGLIEWLHYRKADTLIVGGLATDYCVKATVLQLCRAAPQWRVIVPRGVPGHCSGNHRAGVARNGAGWRGAAGQRGRHRPIFARKPARISCEI